MADVNLEWSCYPFGSYGSSCFEDGSSGALLGNGTSFSISPSQLSDANGHAYVFNLTASSRVENASADQVVDVIAGEIADLG